MAKKSRRNNCATIQTERPPLVTVKEVPDGPKWQWAFVDFYDVTGRSVGNEFKYGKNKPVSKWLRQTIGGLEIVDKEAVLFLQAKNGTG